MAESSEPVASASALVDSPAPGVVRPRVFFDITINNSKAGRIVFELFSDIGEVSTVRVEFVSRKMLIFILSRYLKSQRRLRTSGKATLHTENNNL
jgi:hypothetical protein